MRIEFGFLEGGDHDVVGGEVIVEFCAMAADAVDIELKDVEGLCGR